jgi:hypothetical protein
MSLRHTNAVYRFNRATGAIQWKLGGTPRAESLQVVGDPAFTSGTGTSGFGGQHDARMQPDGSLTLHDNGSSRNRPPRAVRYRIDAAAKTATLVETITDPLVPSSACCGSARKAAGGNWVASWGMNRIVTELTPAGTRVFKLTLPATVFSYRAVPVEKGVLSRATLRIAMNLRAPRS